MSNGTVQHNVAGWNDCTTRTFDEVLRVAKEADEIITELKNSALQ
jgi:hypothetical protein